MGVERSFNFSFIDFLYYAPCSLFFASLCLVVVVKCSKLTSFLYFFAVGIENEIVEMHLA